MNPVLKDMARNLELRKSAENLDFFGRLLADCRELSLWELDTSTLPYSARKWRRRAGEFAREYIRPAAASGDLDPENFDPRPIIKAAAERGFLNLLLPLPFGRAGLPAYFKSANLQLTAVAEEFAAECGGIALALLAHNLGAAPLLLSGNIRTIIRHLLPMYIRGAWFGNPLTMAFAITEPEAGSDVEFSEGAVSARLGVTAVPVKGGWLLNGTKVFISGGAVADKITVYAKLPDEGIESWTCFLVEKSMKGFSAGRHERKMGQRACDASELVFDNVFVPAANIVGSLRSGWANNQNVLNYSRPVVAAMALGHARGAFERALDFCRSPESGFPRLIDRPEVRYELADMLISLSAARSLVWRSCGAFRSNKALSSSAKVFASDTAFKICVRAMDLMGDEGYMHARGVERSMRDARLTQIYEGTNQINRYDVLEHQWRSDIEKNL